MREFDYQATARQLLTPEIVKLIAQIHEHKGRQETFVRMQPKSLDKLLEIAEIQSVDASNRIEGIYTSDARLGALIKENVEPRNRNEREILGYRDVLSTIHKSHDHIPLRANVILQFHRDLYSYSDLSVGGHFKDSDNVIAEYSSDGTAHVRFQPVSTVATPAAVDAICEQYTDALRAGTSDPLLLIPIFILDFLCIHPFRDGNGRMSRLLTLQLLYRAGYTVGKYISIERQIEESKKSYYEALAADSIGWHEGNNTYEDFTIYTLSVLLKAYGLMSARLDDVEDAELSKPERVEKTALRILGKFTKRDLRELCPDVSESTIEATLSNMLKRGIILKLGAGRGTSYILNAGNDLSS